jgi:hypothetical protein
MMSSKSTQVEADSYETTYYKSFEGATIIEFLGIVDDDPTAHQGFPTFKLRFKDGSEGLMEVSQDPEGNGGGFLFGGYVAEKSGA